MKKILVSLALVATMASASAMTFWSGGVLYGTVCRYGAFWTSYPAQNAQPVGSTCPVRNGYGDIIGIGSVTTE